MWGSLGFILVVAAAGPLLQWWGIAAFPWLLAGLSLALVLAARRVPVAEPADAAAPAGSPGVAEAAGGVEPARSRVDGSAAPDAPDVPDASAASAAVAAPAAAAPPVGPVLRQPAVRWFFASVFFTVLAHTSVYAFLSLFVVAQGFDKSVVGGLWAVSVSLEIVAFWTQGRWFSRLSPHGWLQVAAVAGVLRFVATALGGAWLGVLMAAQALHVFTFAAHHSACIALVGRWFPGRLRGRGQALYSALGYGLSGLVGGVTGGWLIERAGLSAVFWAGAASAAIAWACARHFQRLTPAIQAVPVEPPAATR
jgi:PPP family 3-phenylpropionic acid transporter